MNKKASVKLIFLIFSLLFSLMLSACAGIQLAAAPQPPTAEIPLEETPEPLEPTEDVLAVTAAPVEATIALSPTPTVFVSPTPLPPTEDTCIEPRNHPPLAQVPFAEFTQAVLNYLNAGASVNELQAALQYAGVDNKPTAAAEADLTGDGRNDVIVSVIDPQSPSVQKSGALVIYTCVGDEFELIYEQTSPNTAGAPAIVHISDMNADGLLDIFTSSVSCGAHTCFESAEILSWDGADFSNHLDGRTDDLPSPNFRITDYEMDGVYDLEVVARGYASIGAGPQRDSTRVWVYVHESDTWQVASEDIGPSEFRIHILHDADDAFNRGDYPVALVLYEEVASGPNLVDWIDPPAEQLYLGGYARYKMLVIYILQDDLGSALHIFERMEAEYPIEINQHVYVEMAQAYLDGFVSGGVDDACLAAQVYAAVNADRVLGPLGSGAYGYANRDYSPLDVCPYSQ